MARNIVHGVGTAGIVKDTKPELLPHNVWSDGRNVRFESNKFERMGGVVDFLDTDLPGLLSCGFVNSPTENFILYSTGGEVYSYDGVTTSEITKAATTYNETFTHVFDIQSFNGFGLLNQVGDVPQLWDPSDGTNLLVNLPNWDTDWRCYYLRQFKSFLIALNIIDGTDLYPHKMKWSAPAGPGAVPSTWDASDPTNEAGEFDFADTQHGELTGGLELGEQFLVYKQRAIWTFSYVGGIDILSRTPLVKGVGLYVPRSLVEIPNYKGERTVHFFAGEHNFYITDGVSVTPVFEEVFTEYVSDVASFTRYVLGAYSVVYPTQNEVWFCVPQQGDTYATIAFVMNYVNGTYTIRTLSGASNIVSGYGAEYSAAIPADLPYSDGTHFSDETGFENFETGKPINVLLEASGVNERLYHLDYGTADYDGGFFEAYLERTGLPTVQTDPRRPESTILDYDRRKLINWFTTKLFDGSSAAVEVGAQEVENADVYWIDPIVVDTSITRQYLPDPLSGRLMAFRVSSVGDEPFKVGGLDYNVELLGLA